MTSGSANCPINVNPTSTSSADDESSFSLVPTKLVGTLEYVQSLLPGWEESSGSSFWLIKSVVKHEKKEPLLLRSKTCVATPFLVPGLRSGRAIFCWHRSMQRSLLPLRVALEDLDAVHSDVQLRVRQLCLCILESLLNPRLHAQLHFVLCFFRCLP